MAVPPPLFAAGPDSVEDSVVESLLAALPEPVLAIGADDRVVHANAAARALFPTVAAGTPLASHLRAPDVLDAIGAVRHTRQPTQTSWLERVPVERLFEVHVAPARGERDELVIVYLREVSEARRFERMRVDFITNASHEMRTPLASLLGFIETLQGPARNDEKARGRFLALMREQAQRMARLVDDLLSLSRIEQHLHLRPKTPIDLAQVARHIADTLSPLAADNDVEIVLTMDAPIIVPGDRDELMRVAENLIENAIKYGASEATDRTVEVLVRRRGAEAFLTVRDHGPGIAPEHLPRLTERFYRVDAGQSRAKGGTGLGLALVKHIVARHRGRLMIDSQPANVTTFQVSLPLHDEDVKDGARGKRPGPGRAGPAPEGDTPARHKTVISAS